MAAEKSHRTSAFIPSLIPLLILGTVMVLYIGCGRKKIDRLLGGVIATKMELVLDPENHTLQAEAALTLNSAKLDTFYFLLHRDLKISRSLISGGEAPALTEYGEGANLLHHLKRLGKEVYSTDEYDHLKLYGFPLTVGKDAISLEFSYSGTIYDSVKIPEFSRWQIADETTGIIDPQGVFLTPWTGYYPRMAIQKTPYPFHTTINIPQTWEAIVEGYLEERTPGRVIYNSIHPIDGCYLTAGPYKLATINQDNVEIAMYYYPGSEDLTESYLQASAGYLGKYSELFGAYAYDRFSVVENWFPTGYGMPTYTLLGSQVLRLPFIIFTSLGHEICHNWWGNGVFVDYETGNWCEGLTVYCADYLYKKEKSEEEAKQYRMDVDRDYSEYIQRGDEEDFPLREFTERTTPGTRTIGYGKSMMVFHTVERIIGEEVFWNSLRKIYSQKKFQIVSWGDFFKEFERASGKNLTEYERQWIDRTGAPMLLLEPPRFTETDAGEFVEFDLIQTQEGEPYLLQVPVRLTYSDGAVQDEVIDEVHTALYHARVRVERKPLTVEIDPDFHLFRVLSSEETPPTLAGFFAVEDPLIVILDTQKEMKLAYCEFAEQLNRKSTRKPVLASEVNPDSLKGEAILYLGKRDLLMECKPGIWKLGDQEIEGENIVTVYALRDSRTSTKTHLAVWAESPGALQQVARKLPHYGKYGYLAFSSGNNIVKGHWSVETSPLKASIEQ